MFGRLGKSCMRYGAVKYLAVRKHLFLFFLIQGSFSGVCSTGMTTSLTDLFPCSPAIVLYLILPGERPRAISLMSTSTAHLRRAEVTEVNKMERIFTPGVTLDNFYCVIFSRKKTYKFSKMIFIKTLQYP